MWPLFIFSLLYFLVGHVLFSFTKTWGKSYRCVGSPCHLYPEVPSTYFYSPMTEQVRSCPCNRITKAIGITAEELESLMWGENYTTTKNEKNKLDTKTSLNSNLDEKTLQFAFPGPQPQKTGNSLTCFTRFLRICPTARKSAWLVWVDIQAC